MYRTGAMICAPTCDLAYPPLGALNWVSILCGETRRGVGLPRQKNGGSFALLARAGLDLHPMKLGPRPYGFRPFSPGRTESR